MCCSGDFPHVAFNLIILFVLLPTKDALGNEGKGKRRNPSNPGLSGIPLSEESLGQFVRLNQGASGSQSREIVFNIPTAALKNEERNKRRWFHGAFFQPTLLRVVTLYFSQDGCHPGCFTPSSSCRIFRTSNLTLTAFLDQTLNVPHVYVIQLSKVSSPSQCEMPVCPFLN